MKVLIDIQDSSAEDFFSLLKKFPKIKAKVISATKAKTLEEIQKSIQEINEVKEGKIQTRSIGELLDEV